MGGARACDGAGLLAAILDDPADDGARLVYADWLEDVGDAARAEFVRASIGLHATGLRGCGWQPREASGEGCGFCPYCVAARRVERACTADALRGTLAGVVGRFGFRVAWWHPTLSDGHPQERHPTLYLERGFVAEIFLPLGAFLEHAAAVFALHPVERVRLTDRRPLIDDQGRHEWWLSHADQVNMRPNLLPEAIWHRLSGHGGYRGILDYPTERQAFDALSAACVRLGRESRRQGGVKV